MKSWVSIGVGITVAAVGLAVSRVSWVAPAAADDAVATATAVALTVVGGEGGSYTYIGANKCKKCHLPEHKSWAKTKHATALQALQPSQATESKAKHNLDPNKDYSKDATCVACHTVGFGKPGGYAIPDAADEKAVKESKDLAGVGCEACHGPGSEYSKLHEEIMKSKRKYKVDEMYAVGMKKVDESVCLTCHNDKNPTFDKTAKFDFAKEKDENTHEHTPPKQRE
ncbi:MAG: cytochrome c family protein [Planctomycetota bacterium]